MKNLYIFKFKWKNFLRKQREDVRIRKRVKITEIERNVKQNKNNLAFLVWQKNGTDSGDPVSVLKHITKELSFDRTINLWFEFWEKSNQYVYENCYDTSQLIYSQVN